MKTLLKIITFIFLLISILTGVYSGYWLYTNQTNKLSQVSSPLENAEITKEDSVGAEYGTGTDLQSADQLKEYRSDESQPLYLRSYLSIPDIGTNLQIFEGTSNRVLSYGAGTVNPGQSPDKIGNYALAAHNFADWYYGRGLSKLQPYMNDLDGVNAYVTDGDNIYTYRIVDSIKVPREISMDYVEDEFSNKELSDKIKEYGNVTKEVEIDDEKYTFGRLLTLYTCFEEPPDYYMSYNRIIVRGVQTQAVKFEDAPNNLKSLFLVSEDNDSGEDNSEQIGTTNANTNKLNQDKNVIDAFINSQLYKNNKFVYYMFFVSIVLMVISFALLIFIK